MQKYEPRILYSANLHFRSQSKVFKYARTPGNAIIKNASWEICERINFVQLRDDWENCKLGC